MLLTPAHFLLPSMCILMVSILTGRMYSVHIALLCCAVWAECKSAYTPFTIKFSGVLT